MSAELVTRLNELGAGRAAQAIVGGPIEPPPAPPATEPPEPEPGVEPEELEEPEEQEEVEEQPLPKVQKDYPLNGSPMHIAYMNASDAYKVMKREWERAKIGSPREKVGVDASGRPIMEPTDAFPRYAPGAVARGSSLHDGIKIPNEVMISEAAFVAWAEEQGMPALSIQIDSIKAPPGRNITSSRGNRTRRMWNAPTDSGDAQ